MTSPAKPNAWKVSTDRAWMPSAWPTSSRPGRFSMARASMEGKREEHVHLVRQLARAIDAVTGRRLDAGIAGLVAAVVDLHAHSSSNDDRCAGSILSL